MLHSTERFAELTLEKLAEMKEEGKSEKEISQYFNLTLTTLRMVKEKMLQTRWMVQTDIYERMRERGMPRTEIAELLGLNESTIRAWEKTGLIE